jgi:hypothetical protein
MRGGITGTELLGVGDVFGLAVGPAACVAAEALTPVRLALFELSEIDGDPAVRAPVLLVFDCYAS